MMFDRHCSMSRALTFAFVRSAAWACVAVLAACASPASRFYTLGAGGGAAAVQPSAMSAHAGQAAQPALLIEVPPVSTPAEVSRNQFVVETGDTRVDVLEQERWASPPANEIRRALSGDLAARLGTFDVYGAPYPDATPVYRVTVNVRRFESWPGSRAVLDAVWSVRAVRTQTVITCRTLATVPVGAGFAALVDGHRRAVDQMADGIASVVRTLASQAPGRAAKGASAGSTENTGECAAGTQAVAK